MKKIFASIALMMAGAMANAQTTATNWTANDCNSVSHTLFNELDSGKIIVFVWVMPCGSCVNGAKAAYNAVQSFATSNPGKVRYYIADDLGDASCSTLNSWITSGSIGSLSNMTVFSNAGNVIDEADFGGTGMPHVIVMAGSAHTILYNKKGSLTNDQPGITAAINTGITTTGVQAVKTNSALNITPNPAQDVFTIACPTAIEAVTVTSMAGRVVKRTSYEKGFLNPVVNMSDVAPGIYVVRVTDVNGNVLVKQLTKQ